MVERSPVDDLLSQYGAAPRSWAGEEGDWLGRTDRNRERDMAWDAALGDPNYGYQMRLPSGLASARAGIMDKVRTAGDAVFGWMTPEQKSRAAFAGNFLGPAAPLAHAIFMTPGMVGRAQTSLPKTGRGTLESLERTKALTNGMSPDEVLALHKTNPAILDEAWGEHGWMPAYSMSKHQDQPLAWHATPLEVSPAARREFTQTGEAGGALPDVVAPGEGRTRVLDAAPWLKTVETKFGKSDETGGVTQAPFLDEMTGGITARGPTLDDILSVVDHELFHAGPQADMRRLTVDSTERVPQTAAERKFSAELMAAKRRGASKDDLDKLRESIEWAKNFALYANDPFEHLARVSSLYEKSPSLVTTRPDLVNSFTDEAFGMQSPKAKAFVQDSSRPWLTAGSFVSPEARFLRHGSER